MSELVSVKDNQIVVAQAIVQAMEDLEEKQIEYEMQKAQVDMYKDMIGAAMEKSGIKKVEIPMSETKKATITYIPASSRVKKEVDFNALKEQGLYEESVTEKSTAVKSQVRISIK